MVKCISEKQKEKKIYKRYIQNAFIFILISMCVLFVYSRNGFENNSYANFIPLPKRNLTRVNKTALKRPSSTHVAGKHVTNTAQLLNTKTTEENKRLDNTIDNEDSGAENDTTEAVGTFESTANSQLDHQSWKYARKVGLNFEQWKKFQSKVNFKDLTPIRLRNQHNRHRDHHHFFQPSFFNIRKPEYNIMNMEPITFDERYKNPCWIGNRQNGLFHDDAFHCLPYFYLIGVKKSGTTDFMGRLSKHPEYCRPLQKESQWLARRRFGINLKSKSLTFKGHDLSKVEAYSALFDRAAMCISSKNSGSHRITGEASPSNFHMHTYWERLPGNENLSEPRYTNFHYINHLTPNVKIIVLFRDPTTRLYSDFLHTTGSRYGKLSPAMFHDDVLKLTTAYTDCFKRSSLRSCVYNNTLQKQLGQDGTHLHQSFCAGIYYVFMKDMISVFGKDRILPIYMSDYVTKMEATFVEVFSFLNMSDVDKRTMDFILNNRKKNHKRYPAPMYEETKSILYNFYKPFNAKMASLMEDSRYIFPQS